MNGLRVETRQDRAEYLRSELVWLRKQNVEAIDCPSWERPRLRKLLSDDIAAAERELAGLERKA